MTQRPHSVTVIGCLFAAVGMFGLVYHAGEFNADSPFRYEPIWVCFVRLLAVIFALFMLRGSNWARWGLLGWMAYHVILSGFHSLTQLVVHGLLFAVIAYLLLRPRVSAYFRSARTQPTQVPDTPSARSPDTA
jgi:hypothetical protein